MPEKVGIAIRKTVTLDKYTSGKEATVLTIKSSLLKKRRTLHI